MLLYECRCVIISVVSERRRQFQRREDIVYVRGDSNDEVQ